MKLSRMHNNKSNGCPRTRNLRSLSTLEVPIVTNTNFLLTISKDCREIRLGEFIKLSVKRKCLDFLLNSLNTFLKKMYRDQFGEFVCGS